MHSELLRKLPKVDDILRDAYMAEKTCGISRKQVTDVVRAVIEQKREALLHSDDRLEDGAFCFETIRDEALKRLETLEIPSLRPVINATGVVLHTNLGRARLGRSAVKAVCEAAAGYSTLEYNPSSGKRGSRHDHTEALICKVTGAEAAMVVNNNAAATVLCLAALGRGKEIILSRGELVEIGGSFRIPEIMEESGAILKEIGTTNKTKPQDYEKAINENTGILLKVHTSNYKIIGFTEETTVKQLAELGKKYELPVVYDMGNGLIVDLSDRGIDEPTVRDGLLQGADIVLFSGDKLLGGPQGGIIAGRKKYVDLMKDHPLARVLRIDKMTAAAMEAVFWDYCMGDAGGSENPTLFMLRREREELLCAAERLKEEIDALKLGLKTEIVFSEAVVGGGSAPSTVLPGYAVTLWHEKFSTAQIEEKLRRGKLPVIARIVKNRVLVDVRTVMRREEEEIVKKLEIIMKELEMK